MQASQPNEGNWFADDMIKGYENLSNKIVQTKEY